MNTALYRGRITMILLNIFKAIIEIDFFRNAIIAAIIIGVISPLVGTVVVIRRLSNIADTLSHFSLAGVVIGVFLAKILVPILKISIDPIFMGIIFSIGGTFLIEKIRNFYRNYKELSMAIIISLGVSLTGLFISITDGITTSFTTALLFGSILAVSLTDLILVLFFAICIFVFIVFYYRQIITLCFDETYARISGINVKRLQLAITIVLALTISIFIELVGVLLISTLLIIPVASSILIGKSFKNTIVISIILSMFSILVGFTASYYFLWPLGSTIALVNIILLFIIFFTLKIRDIRYKTKKK